MIKANEGSGTAIGLENGSDRMSSTFEFVAFTVLLFLEIHFEKAYIHLFSSPPAFAEINWPGSFSFWRGTS